MAILLGARVSKPGDPPMTARGNRHGSADRLRIMLKLTTEEFNTFFTERMNVETRERGAELRDELRGDIIVLGGEAWGLLGLPRVDFFHTFETGRAMYLLIPHPSGRNHMYNSEATRERTRREICRHRR